MVAVHPWRVPNEGAQWDGTEQESRAPALADGRGQMMANGDQAMKRKFASMFMNPAYRPELHQTVFETAHQDTHIFTVRDFEEAVALAQRLVEEGFGALEVCGAFRPDQVRALIEATDNRLAIGYSTHFPEQDELFAAFFRKG